jgi:hypothetical protein
MSAGPRLTGMMTDFYVLKDERGSVGGVYQLSTRQRLMHVAQRAKRGTKSECHTPSQNQRTAESDVWRANSASVISLATLNTDDIAGKQFSRYLLSATWLHVAILPWNDAHPTGFTPFGNSSPHRMKKLAASERAARAALLLVAEQARPDADRRAGGRISSRQSHRGDSRVETGDSTSTSHPPPPCCIHIPSRILVQTRYTLDRRSLDSHTRTVQA